MNHIALLVLMLTFCPLASAGNVTIDIYENSDGVYFIEVNDGGLIACDGTQCTVDISNRSSAFTLSNDDIKAIARQTSAEIGTLNTDGGLSESLLTEALANSDRESYDTLKAYIERTWMKSTVEYNNCTVELAESKGALSTLDAKFAVYDEQIKYKDIIIESHERDMKLYWGLVIILTLALFAVFAAKADIIRTLIDYKERK